MPPTFFDIVTTIGLLHFRARGVEAAILEVGLGGRLDSTNVFLPDVCILTRLGLDHTEKLGATLDLIAAEKAGIIKPSRPVIAHAQEPEARRVGEKRCLETGSPISWLGEDVRIEAEGGTDPSGFSVHTPKGRYPGLTLSALGAHQRLNALAKGIDAGKKIIKREQYAVGAGYGGDVVEHTGDAGVGSNQRAHIDIDRRRLGLGLVASE